MLLADIFYSKEKYADLLIELWATSFGAMPK